MGGGGGNNRELPPRCLGGFRGKAKVCDGAGHVVGFRLQEQIFGFEVTVTNALCVCVCVCVSNGRLGLKSGCEGGGEGEGYG